MKKLKELLGEVFDETPKVDKHSVIEGVRNYGIVGQSLYNNNDIMEVAKQLARVAESAHGHVLSETDDWFDQVSVNKNMQSLKKRVAEFQKTAQESHALNQRLTSLYEDIGTVLNRYYEIDEVMNEDAGDMDNDGKNEPDSEEYLDSKRDAITKAVKGESLDPERGPSDPAQDGEETLNKESLDHTESDDIDKPDKEGEGRANDLDGTPKTEGKKFKRLADASNVVSLSAIARDIYKK